MLSDTMVALAESRMLQRQPKRRMQIPVGCTEVWQVTKFKNNVLREHLGVFTDYDSAIEVWRDHASMCRFLESTREIRLDRKAAMKFGSKWHLVNITPVNIGGLVDDRETNPPSSVSTDPAPTHQEVPGGQPADEDRRTDPLGSTRW